MRGALFLAAILLCLSACGGSDGGSAIGWKTHRIDDGGFSIEVPEAWVTLQKFDKQSVDEFVEDHPRFAGFKQAARDRLVKFLAGDPERSKGFATNVTVVVHDLGRPITLTAYEREVVKEQGRNFGGSSVQVQLPAGSCIRLTGDYSANFGGGPRTLAVVQYSCLRNQTEYVVTFTTLKGQRARYRTTFARSARSFRID